VLFEPLRASSERHVARVVTLWSRFERKLARLERKVAHFERKSPQEEPLSTRPEPLLEASERKLARSEPLVERSVMLEPHDERLELVSVPLDSQIEPLQGPKVTKSTMSALSQPPRCRRRR